jgi:hypothetical protein
MMARMILQISLGESQHPTDEKACARRRDELSGSKLSLPCGERHVAGLYVEGLVGCIVLQDCVARVLDLRL